MFESGEFGSAWWSGVQAINGGRVRDGAGLVVEVG